MAATDQMQFHSTLPADASASGLPEEGIAGKVLSVASALRPCGDDATITKANDMKAKLIMFR